MVIPEPYSTSASLPVPLFYSSSFNTYHNPPHIFLYLLSLPATSNFLLLTLLSFTFLHILLLVHYDTTRLFFSMYIFSFFKTKSPSTCYSSLLNTFTPTFFISSTTLTTSLSLRLAIFIFSNISTSVSSITTLYKLQIQWSLINT